MTTPYTQLTAAQRLQFISDFRSFANDAMPKLQAAATGEWTADNSKDMENGLNLIQAFPYAVDFAQKSLLLGDYRNRVNRLAFYVDKIKTQISGDLSANGSATVDDSKVQQKIDDAISNITGTAPESLNTLQKIAAEMTDPNNNAATTVLDKLKDSVYYSTL